MAFEPPVADALGATEEGEEGLGAAEAGGEEEEVPTLTLEPATESAKVWLADEEGFAAGPTVEAEAAEVAPGEELGPPAPPVEGTARIAGARANPMIAISATATDHHPGRG